MKELKKDLDFSLPPDQLMQLEIFLSGKPSTSVLAATTKKADIPPQIVSKLSPV